jgi:hypothetical protein
MNATVYWDNLETTHGPLVCAPIGGDPSYAFVCSYTLSFLPAIQILTALWLFYTTYQGVRLFRWSKVNNTTQTRSMKRGTQVAAPGESSQKSFRIKAKRLSQVGENLTHGAQLALVVGALTLFRSLALLLSGCGTSYPVEETRGLVGDGFCEFILFYFL